MNLAQHGLIMNAFISLQFVYCSLVWMRNSRKLNNHINIIYERTLGTVFRNLELTFQQLLKQ